MICFPEEQLLLSCARRSVRPELADHVKNLLQGEIDWERLFQSAHRHGLIPLLHQQAASLPPGTVPPVPLDKLRQEAQRNIRHNLLLTEELLKVLGFLEAAGIPAVPLKGPVLAACLYGDIGLRQFSDLDILVPRPSVPQAKERLVSNGYRPLWTGARGFASCRSEPHHQLVRQEGGLVVELHWELTPPSFYVPFDPKDLWDRLESVSIGGTEVRTLAAEDLLLFLCAHGSKHLWERLGWVCDVAQLVQLHQQIDWDRLIRSARRAGAQRMLFLGLFLANDLLGVELPPEISQKVIHDGRVRRLAVDMKKRFFKGAAGPFGFLELLPFYLRMRERWRDKIRDSFFHTLTLVTPTEEEWGLLSLPDFLFPLYYLLRPVRLMAKYGGRLLRSFRRKRGAEAGI